MISIPAKWAKDNNLDKGAEIDLEIENNNLIVKSEEKKSEKIARLKISTGAESSIRTMITNAYRLGYSKLIITFNNEQELKFIKKSTKINLLGFEITDIKENTCTIENITEPSNEHVEKIFLKVLFSISELLKSTKEQLQGLERKEYINELEEKIYQYDNFVRRTHSLSKEEDTPIKWIFHSQLIHAQREVFFLAKFVEENKIKVSKEIIKLYEELEKIYENLKQGYLKNDLKRLEEIHQMEKEIILIETYKLFEKTKGKENIIIHRIASAVRKFYLSASPLIGLQLWNTQEK